jgi:peptidoglycan/LPS O-acetylase OafA/YrhL
MNIDFRNLTVFHPIPQSWRLSQVMGSAVVLALITFVAIRYSRTRPWLLMGWCWFVVLLLPVIGIIFATNYALADRYSYLSSIGLLIGLCWSLPSSLGQGRVRQCFVGATVAVVLIFLGIVTAINVNYWQDRVTL